MAAIAMGAAPVVGGALFGATVGQLRGPNLRERIKQDMELLEQMPETEAARRETLRRSIDDRIDELITAEDTARQLRATASSYHAAGVTSSSFCARCSSRLSGGLSTTTGTVGCPCSLRRLWRRSWRPATQSGVCAEACAGCVVAPIVVSSRKRRRIGRTRVSTG
ncbi:hypothetical protein [Mycobacterium sp.]|uniref:hypothetical protein n=1 Tax=Mycobacterium sp. TaxID=1785 RepID=UPI003F96A4A4